MAALERRVKNIEGHEGLTMDAEKLTDENDQRDCTLPPLERLKIIAAICLQAQPISRQMDTIMWLATEGEEGKDWGHERPRV